MRTIALLASVFALSIFSGACTTEEVVSNPKPKKSKTSTHTGTENENGEHGSNAPADDTSGTTPNPDEGTTIQSGSWADGKTVDANLTIGAGETVTIEPGATVNMGADVTVTVKGTLKIASTAKHAIMTGASWQGIILAEGGKLDADGLDIKGAKAGLWTQAGNLDSTFKNGTLDAATPFKMEAGSKLTVDHSKVIAGGGSAIAGTFVANYMDYDKGANGGLTLNDAAGSMKITNSTLHGAGGGDYVISNAGKSVTVTRSAISGSHCAFHFSGKGADQFLIDGVDVRNNGVGGMLYSSGAGPNEVKNTNFTANNEYDIDFGANTNGAIKFTNTFGTIPTKTNITQVTPAADLLPPASVGPAAE